MLRDNLSDKISHVNRVRAACTDSHLTTVGLRRLDREIGSVTSQMKPVERADPDSRSCRNFKSLAHRHALFPRVEILITDPRLDRVLNHSRLHRPFGKDFHTSWVDGEGRILQHEHETRTILVLDAAHPCVVARVANSIDRLLKIIIDDLRTCSLLNPQAAEIDAMFSYEAVNPIRP